MQVNYTQSESGHLVVVALYGNCLAIKVGDQVFMIDNPTAPNPVGKVRTVNYYQGDTPESLFARIEGQQPDPSNSLQYSTPKTYEPGDAGKFKP